MQKKYIYLFLVLLLTSLSVQAEIPVRSYEKMPKNESAVKSLSSQWSKGQLETLLRDFVSSSRPSRLAGTEGNTKAREWIVARIKKADPKNTGKLTIDEFSPNVLRAREFYQKEFLEEVQSKLSPKDPNYIRWDNFTKDILRFLDPQKSFKGTNILWEKKGYISSDDLLIVLANYDTLSIDSKNYKLNLNAPMPGADSNGSGVAVLLSLIELFSSIEIPKTVWIVFTDFDEFAFSGTASFLEKQTESLKKFRSVSAISLTMLGYDSKSRDKEKKFGNMSLYVRKPTETGHLQDKNLVSKLTSKTWDDTVRFTVVSNGFNSSGHSLFWEKGYPAAVFTQNWESDLNPNEHTSEDIVETLNMNTLYGSYRFVAGAIMGWALDL